MPFSHQTFLFLLLTGVTCRRATGFLLSTPFAHPTTSSCCRPEANTAATTTTTKPSSSTTPFYGFLWLAASSSRDNGDSDPSAIPNNTIVTKEMFLRELLKDPNDDDEATDVDDNGSSVPSVTVKRKNNNKSNNHKKQQQQKAYRVLDNRDRLPFSVKVATPDPYTHPDVKAARKQSVTPKKRHDAIENGISSSLYMDYQPTSSSGKQKKKNNNNNYNNNDDKTASLDTSTWLGDFVLDKYTTTGDLLEIGDQQFKVVRHKCQYKYAGGKRFVMVRKILQVKEVGRLRTEEYLSTLLREEPFPASPEQGEFPHEEA